MAPAPRVSHVRGWRRAVGESRASFLAAGRRMRAPLASREFRLLWAGQAISQFGDPLQAVALVWLVLERTDSAVALSAALLALSAPRVALMLLGGVLADRLSPRRVMLWADLARAAAAACLVVLCLAPGGPLWLAALCSVLLVFGSASGLFSPAASSITPHIVAPEQIQAATSLRQATPQVASLMAAPLGGALVAAAGPALALGLNAGSFVVAAMATLAMRPQLGQAGTHTRAGGEPGPGRGGGGWAVLHEALEGLRTIRQLRWLTTILAMETALTLLTTGPVTLGLPLLAWEGADREGGAEGYGLLLAGLGLGHVIGMLAVAALPRVRRRGTLYCLQLAAQGLLFSGLVNAPLLLAAVYMALAGVLNGLWLAMFFSLVQSTVDRAQLGRVMATVSLALTGLGPVSQAAAGPLEQLLGPRLLFLLAGMIAVLVGGAGLLVRSLRELD
jgi:MFS family permease